MVHFSHKRYQIVEAMGEEEAKILAQYVEIKKGNDFKVLHTEKLPDDYMRFPK